MISIIISIIFIFCMILVFIALYNKEIIEFELTFSIPLKFSIAWKKQNISDNRKK